MLLLFWPDALSSVEWSFQFSSPNNSLGVLSNLLGKDSPTPFIFNSMTGELQKHMGAMMGWNWFPLQIRVLTLTFLKHFYYLHLQVTCILKSWIRKVIKDAIDSGNWFCQTSTKGLLSTVMIWIPWVSLFVRCSWAWSHSHVHVNSALGALLDVLKTVQWLQKWQTSKLESHDGGVTGILIEQGDSSFFYSVWSQPSVCSSNPTSQTS